MKQYPDFYACSKDQNEVKEPQTPQEHLENFISPQASETSLDAVETSEHRRTNRTYRDFAISGREKDIRHNQSVYSLLDNIEFKSRLERYDSCRDLAYFVRHKTTHEVQVRASSCKLRWCPLCINSKRFAISQNVALWLKKIDKPRLLTFTMKHRDEDLFIQIRNLYKYFKNIRRAKWFKKNVRGGVWFFQITMNSTTGQWHPHIHCLVDSNFLQHKELSALWELITGDSKIVDIRFVKDKKKTAEYVARYVAAPCRLADFQLGDSVNIVQAMHNLRICGKFGTGRTCVLKVTLPDDKDDWENIGDFSTIFNNELHPDWCRYIRGCWMSKKPMDIKPPPDLKNASSPFAEKRVVQEQYYMFN